MAIGGACAKCEFDTWGHFPYSVCSLMWICMNLYRFYGFVWICVDLYGFVWICMDLYGFVLICVNLHDLLWICMRLM